MNASARSGAIDRLAPAALAVLFVVTLLLHQPWAAAPFSPTDFSEFLPILMRNDSFGSRLTAFVQQYGAEGRFNLLQYASLAFKWSVLGDSPVRWQLLRAVQMALLVSGVYVLLRKLAISAAGAAVGASLMLLGGAGTSAFTRLTMGEPLATLCIVGAAILAVDYAKRERWGVAAAGICALTAAALLTKELFVAAIPFLLVLACCRSADGRWIWPRLTERRIWVLVVAGAFTVVAVMIPVFWTLRHAREGSFSSAYGVGTLGYGRFKAALDWLLLPWSRQEASKILQWVGLTPNYVFLGTLVAALAVARRDWRAWIGLALLGFSLPLAFAILYTPWIYVLPFYALPTAIGGAVLLGCAVDQLRRNWSSVGQLVAIAGGVAVVVSLALAFDSAERARADRFVARSLVDRFVAETTARAVAISSRRPVGGAQAWTGRGPTIVRYAGVITGKGLPPSKDAHCSTLRQYHDAPPFPILLVSFREDCGVLWTESSTVAQPYRAVSLWPPWFGTDSVRVDLVVVTPNANRMSSGF